jgi:chemotaxis protein CheD
LPERGVNRLKEQLSQFYLKPGEMYFSDKPAVVVTVLGSCLSVTMFHRRRGLGAICHGLLPKCSGQKGCYGECLEGFKYVDCSIRRMVQVFDHYKVRRSEIEIKCFGGAEMFTRKIEGSNTVSVGRQNIISAENIFRSEGLKLNAKDIGGLQGRKIFFYTHTGDVLLKRLKKAEETNLT